MQRASSFSFASLVLILSSIGCFCFSGFFQSQYARTYGAKFGRSVVGLANPEAYKNGEAAMLFADILVCVLAVVLALRHKHWCHWLAVAVAIGASLLILVQLASVL